MNARAFDCSVNVGRSGYCAVMLCKSVQVLRPNASTSAGQSGDGEIGALVEEDDVCFLVRAAQEANEVQLWQLVMWVSLVCLCCLGRGRAYGFPSGPRTTPFGSFFGVRSV
jgi:hypothetical protein